MESFRFRMNRVSGLVPPALVLLLYLVCTDGSGISESGNARMEASRHLPSNDLPSGKKLRRMFLEDGAVSRPLGWYPRDDRYLLALCLTGGLSEQMICLKKTFYLAGILNRTLVVPASAVAYTKDIRLPGWDWGHVVDFPRMRSCLEPKAGPKTVYLVPEVLQLLTQAKLKVSKIHCAVPGAPPTATCYHQLPVNGLLEVNGNAIDLPHVTERNVVQSPLKVGQRASVDDVAKAFGPIEDQTLCLGDVTELDFQIPGGLLSSPSPSPDCPNIWRPHGAVMSFVDGILETLLGTQYASVYWKRGKSPKKSPADEDAPPAADLPVKDVATRIREKLQDQDVNVLYLATDARKSDIDTLEALLRDGKLGKRFAAILTLRQVLADEEWLLQQFWSKEAMLLEKKFNNGVAFSLIDKLVCARAKYFLGTESSTVTDDILDIRKHEGLENPPTVAPVF